MLFTILATFLLQATLLLGAAVTLRRLLRNRTPAETRYRMLFVITACLPLLAAASVFQVRPSARSVSAEPKTVATAAFSSDMAVAPPTASKRALPIEVPLKIAGILFAVWAAGALFFACVSLYSRMATSNSLRRMKPCRDPVWQEALEAATARYAIRRRIRLLDGSSLPPCTAGFLGRTIVVPTADGTWSRGKREAVLLHEAAHVKRWDVPLMTFIELVAAAAWCVPFMPFVVRSLVEDREEACDAAAIEKGAKPSDYASLILELAACRSYAPLIGNAGMVGRTRTEARIKKIIDKDGRERENRFLGRAVITLLLLAGLTVGGTGTLSRVFALEAAEATGIKTSSAGLVGSDGYPLTDLPTASPLVGKWRVTQGFGMRKHPITGESYRHVGMDLSNGREGASVLATLAGKVVQAEYEKNSGNSVAVGDGRVLVRFSKLKDIRVAVGDRVQVGSEIGTVGATGVATGPHLHYEIWVDGNAVDPAAPLKAGGARFDGLGEE